MPRPVCQAGRFGRRECGRQAIYSVRILLDRGDEYPDNVLICGRCYPKFAILQSDRIIDLEEGK